MLLFQNHQPKLQYLRRNCELPLGKIAISHSVAYTLLAVPAFMAVVPEMRSTYLRQKVRRTLTS